MNKDTFRYITGETVNVGDRIGYDALDGRGIVSKGQIAGVFVSNSTEACEYSCETTGGILISFDDGDCQLWEEADSHLILLGRCATSNEND